MHKQGYRVFGSTGLAFRVGRLLLALTVLASLMAPVAPAGAAHGAVGADQRVSGAVDVTFGDADLEAAVRAAISKPSGAITDADMDTLTSLTADSQNISSLTGLEYAHNLTSLQLMSNQISDLTPLAGLTALRTLYLGQNQISNVTPLAGLTNLEQLYLSNNSISSITALAGLSKISYLYLASNQISDISALSGMPLLSGLYLNNNASLSSISALSSCTNLYYVQLSDTEVTDLSAFSGKSKLRYLYLINAAVTSVSPLAGLTGLQVLGLYGNQVTDVTPLAGLSGLTFLDLQYNSVTDISALSGLSAIMTLQLDHNNVSDLTPLSGLTTLETLRLNWNQITTLAPISGLTGLTDLSCEVNQITDVSAVAGMTNLRRLCIGNNPISEADALTGLTLIEYLEVDGTNLHDLSAFVANSGVASGDVVYLDSNYLLLGPGGNDQAALDTLVGRGATVSSAGQQTGTAVPGVTGKTQVSAEASLTAVGLGLGAVSEANHPTVPVGKVISQYPIAADNVADGGDVDLVISKGPLKTAVTVTKPVAYRTTSPYSAVAGILAKYKTYKWAGKLTPRHGSGGHAVYISISKYDKAKKKFVYLRKYTATNLSKTTYTQYWVNFPLGPGRYKLTPVAVEDTYHLRSVGAPNYATVQ